jgi:sugar-specific transcriptional regulator TrmB
MPETNTQISYISSLQLAGLTPEQAEIYQVLLKNGPLPAGKIHQKTPYKRGLVYKLLDSMVESGVVIKRTDLAKIAIFEPAHPLKLKELAETKEKEAKQSQSALTGIIDQMTSEYNLVSGKPGVQFFEGIEGIQKAYEQILLNARQIKIFASNIDRNNPELNKLIEEQTKKQKRLGITTKAIGSLSDNLLSKQEVQNLQELNIELRRLPNFELPSQIIIFKDRVAISALTPELVTTIIQNSAISQTLELLFDTFWSIASKDSSLSPQSLSETQSPDL